MIIDLSEITDLSADGIALLLKHIADKRLTGNTRIIGTEPIDIPSRERLITSGFYRHVRSPRGRVDHTNDMFVLARKSEQVDNAIAAKVRKEATSWLYARERKLPALYASLIECMANTRNHAHGGSKNSARETWWLAVSRDPLRRTISVAFIDTGVGLFESVKIRGVIDRFKMRVGLYTNIDVLKDLLLGQITSRTGLPYRGKGLPKIYNYLLRGDFSKLVIVANDVYADVGAGVYRNVSPSLDGTFIYWEIRGDE